MQSLLQELRRIGRRLARAPLFTGVTLLTLAVGIGANTAIFSVVNSVLLKPLPFDQPDRLVGLWHTAPGINFKVLNISPSLYFTYREEGKVFENLGLYNDSAASVTGLAEPERVDVLEVNASTLATLRVQPAIGRAFSDNDDSPGAPRTVILSYNYWQRRFGGNPSAVGQRLMVDGKARDIIGVMPASFRFLNDDPQLLMPFQFNRAELFFGNFSYQGVGRLKPGVTLEQANADVGRMIPLGLNKFPPPPGFKLEIFQQARFGPNLHMFHEDLVGDIGKILWVLMGTVGIVLFIACANVANLFLVRAEGRQQELAIRTALGASRGVIARELLSESTLLGIGGGLIGLGLAYGGIRLLVGLAPSRLPRLNEIAIDPAALAFTLAISLFAGLLFGLIPVLRFGDSRVGSTLKEGGRGSSDGRQRHRTRGALAVVQVALALVLLIGSGLMLRTFQALRNVQPGFVRPGEVLTLRLSIPEGEVPDAEQSVRVHQAIVDRISQIPGVSSVALTSSVTMSGSNSNDPVFIEDRPLPEGQLPPIRRYKSLGPGYFKTMGNPVVAGRDFTWTDIYDKRPVAIISEDLARSLWKEPAAALGKRVRESPKGVWREIVGVAAAERDDGVNQPAPVIAYWPMLLKDFWGQPIMVRRSMTYVIRSPRTGTAAFMDEVRKAVWSVNPNLPLASVRTLQRIYERSMERTSFTLVMLAISGGMALLLGIVGIYGVIAYSVAQRTREIGIRMALGAQKDDVTGMFIREGATLTVIGITAGLVASVGLTRVMSALLFGVSAMDPMTYSGVSLGLVAATLVASYLPARRATAVDPVRSLRSE